MSTIGLKKTAQNLKSSYHILELDGLYWFVTKKGDGKCRENTDILSGVALGFWLSLTTLLSAPLKRKGLTLRGKCIIIKVLV